MVARKIEVTRLKNGHRNVAFNVRKPKFTWRSIYKTALKYAQADTPDRSTFAN